MRKISFLILSGLLMISCLPVSAANVDLGVKSNSLKLSKDESSLIAGETVRVYASVFNVGEEDASAAAFFYRDTEFLGEATVSAKVNGYEDEVYVDFVVPDHEFKIYVELKGITPEDSNPVNNQALSHIFVVQQDYDGDRLTDDVDSDDDNDGWSDLEEESQGTNPKNQDTDGDGVIDSADQYPLDPLKSEIKQLEPVAEPLNPVPDAPPINPDPKPVITPLKLAGEKVLFPNGTEEPTEKKSEMVEAFYQSSEVEFLKEVRLKAQQVNWNTFHFSFDTNLFEVDPGQLEYILSYGDGSGSNQIGNHKYKTTGDYYITLKVKGPWDNYLFDSAQVRVQFWSVYNYWLWLIVLIIVVLSFMLSASFSHKSHRSRNVKREISDK